MSSLIHFPVLPATDVEAYLGSRLSSVISVFRSGYVGLLRQLPEH